MQGRGLGWGRPVDPREREREMYAHRGGLPSYPFRHFCLRETTAALWLLDVAAYLAGVPIPRRTCCKYVFSKAGALVATREPPLSPRPSAPAGPLLALASLPLLVLRLAPAPVICFLNPPSGPVSL